MTHPKKPPFSFQEIIRSLDKYWCKKGCVLLQPLDIELGAGTMHWATVLKSLGEDPWRAAYVQPCRRPADGRYGDNPNRLQHYYQYQVILKPSDKKSQSLYLDSLEALGIARTAHDIRFIDDDWESPVLGAKGVGWEVWCDGMEISQFTYFQQIGGIACHPVSTEITYGLERLAMFVQQRDIYDLVYAWDAHGEPVHYGEIFKDNEREQSRFNFELADTALLLRWLGEYEQQADTLLTEKCLRPAYEHCLKASHVFNLLEARGALSVTERQNIILRIRRRVARCCRLWIDQQASPNARAPNENSPNESHA